MSATHAARVLGDIEDGAVSMSPDGRITIPSDITNVRTYRAIVRHLIADGCAARSWYSDSVVLNAYGLVALAVERGKA